LTGFHYENNNELIETTVGYIDVLLYFRKRSSFHQMWMNAWLINRAMLTQHVTTLPEAMFVRAISDLQEMVSTALVNF